MTMKVGIWGKHRIADRWSQMVYKVVKHISDSPVYVDAPLNSDGLERTLHRELLLPNDVLSPSVQEEISHDNRKNNKTKIKIPQKSQLSEADGEVCQPGSDRVDPGFSPSDCDDIT